MSSSSNITGLLAQLINGTTESSTPSTSTANLNRVSMQTAFYNSGRQARESITTPSINATKKAIVLKHIDDSPTRNSTAGSGTTWFSTMQDFLPRYGISETATNALSTTGVANYPKYRVWILPDNLDSDGAVPLLREGEITNLDRFPLCSVKDISMTEELVEGALIRVDFENRAIKSDAYVINIMNNTEEFGRAIFTELAGIASPLGACLPCADASPSVSHPSGDAISTEDSRIALHNAYVALKTDSGTRPIDKADIYNRLNGGLQNSNLALGILSNSQHESNFNSNAVSSALQESSIGLWQMNVGSIGRVGTPLSSMTTYAEENLPESIRIPSNSRVIIYFAGGQLATKNNIPVVTATDYASGNRDVSALYNMLSDPDEQIDFVIEAAENMLSQIDPSPDISAGDWALWWQLYFEQPGVLEDERLATAESLARELGVA